jgi:hypothetical protein
MSHKHPLIILLSISLAATSFCTQLAAANIEGKLFDSDTEISVTLTAPFKRLFAKNDDGTNGAGMLHYTDAKGDRREVNVQISTGGGMRSDYCQFPPLTLNLEATEIAGTPFEGLGALYLTTHCRRGSQNEQYMYLEYLIYRMYGLVTEYALAVRRMNISYEDTDTRQPTVDAYAYAIEDVNATAAQLGMSRIKVESHELKDIDLRSLAMLSLFQFMIGNTDWSALRPRPPDPCCHNAHIIANPDNGTKHFVVAFDFDQAGLINARYATPSVILPIRSVRQRLYRGFCAEQPYLPETIEALNRAKPQFEALIRDDAFLNERSRSSALSYIEESYRIINTDGTLQAEIVGRCRS